MYILVAACFLHDIIILFRLLPIISDILLLHITRNSYKTADFSVLVPYVLIELHDTNFYIYVPSIKIHSSMGESTPFMLKEETLLVFTFSAEIPRRQYRNGLKSLEYSATKIVKLNKNY